MMSRNIKLLTWFNFFTDFKLYAPIAIIYFSKVTGSFALGMSIFGAAQLSAALLINILIYWRLFKHQTKN